MFLENIYWVGWCIRFIGIKKYEGIEVDCKLFLKCFDVMGRKCIIYFV